MLTFVIMGAWRLLLLELVSRSFLGKIALLSKNGIFASISFFEALRNCSDAVLNLDETVSHFLPG